ncbi:MAG: hypothetical protein DWQ31_08660 [Planctomycetota bacterium]|nr:MAG: hypothetical protein DWQ31_08660 [Planctomycetota bacterium]REJ86937.1 MAG: hypothetical protein DWQ35_22510 [Planctomycetota bacterium]REK24936.1 MAG: hypothetical protein DWQ42_12660 [Planctomycetota bacterium]REK48525.1 MAG: hypothetical protein DWQ46_02190 [Planctomycetota bacterium]
MAKIEKGRLDGVWGMRTRTAEELRAWAEDLEAQIRDPKNTDDPKWLQRWADRMRRLADKKEKSLEHKERQR